MQKRIWELDALRGLFVLGMVVVHFVYDLVELWGIVQWEYPAAFLLVKDWGGLLFLLISGICVTLGHRSVRRGAIVLACGAVISAVTVGMYWLRLSDRSIIIYFGVLHCLGVSMLLWPLLKKWPWQALLALAAALLALGYWFGTLRLGSNWLLAFNLRSDSFASSDYFPLLPDFGWFLLGAVLGKTLYRRKRSVLPNARCQFRPLQAVGRHSLEIYMLHQPVLSGICYLLALLK